MFIVDIGNQKIKVAIFRAEKVTNFFTVDTNSSQFELIFDFLKQHTFKHVVIGSVVKDIDEELKTFLQEKFPSAKIIVIQKKDFLKKNFYSFGKKSEEEVGLDILGFGYYLLKNEEQSLGISFGTLTFACVVANGKMQGVSIAPQFSVEPFSEYSSVSLIDDFQINLKQGKHFGHDTNSAISSGLIHYFLGFIKSLYSQAYDDFQVNKIYISGGNANFLSKLDLGYQFTFDPHIVLKGYLLIAKELI